MGFEFVEFIVFIGWKHNNLENGLLGFKLYKLYKPKKQRYEI